MCMCWLSTYLTQAVVIFDEALVAQWDFEAGDYPYYQRKYCMVGGSCWCWCFRRTDNLQSAQTLCRPYILAVDAHHTVRLRIWHSDWTPTSHLRHCVLFPLLHAAHFARVCGQQCFRSISLLVCGCVSESILERLEMTYSVERKQIL